MDNSAPLSTQTVKDQRSLDALVAEKVIGLPNIIPEWACGYLPDGCGLEVADFQDGGSRGIKLDDAGNIVDADPVYYGWYDERHPVYGALREDGSEWGKKVVPFYSTDIVAAFQVVEKMHARLFAQNEWPRANLLTLSCRGVTQGWAAAFVCVHESDEWFETPEQFGGAKAETVPMAICLAALKALGLEVSHG